MLVLGLVGVDPIDILVERPESATVLRALFPHRTILSWAEMAALWSGHALPNPSTRLSQFRSWLEREVPGESERYLFTIERLRESLITDHDHVDYCFSLLPETPRHEKLRGLFHQYLDSELAEDWTQQAWEAIEAIKSDQTAVPLPERVTLWRSDEPTFLFDELKTTLELKGHLATESMENHGRAPICLKGAAADLLDHLARRAAILIQRGFPPERIGIPFAGEPQNLTYLQMALAYYQVPFQTFGFAPKSSPTHFEARIQYRQDRKLPLKERLERSRNTLAGKEVHRVPEAALASEPSVRIYPFQPLPETLGVELAFVDDSYLYPKRYPFCLEEEDVDRLHQDGFTLPRHRDLRTRRWRQLAAWLRKGGRRVLYSETLDQAGFGDHWRNLAPPVPEEISPREEDTQVELPKKPLSATQLENYVRCPSQYLFSNRLKLDPIAKEWDQKYALLFGSAVHDALEHHIKEGGAPDDQNALEHRFLEAVQKNAPALDPEHAYTQILLEHFRRLLVGFGEMETQRKALFGMTKPLALEKDFLFEIAGIEVRGKIDRIEETEDGSLVVFDYKTGNVYFTPNHIDQGTHFQALLYILAAEKEYPDQTLRGFLFYDLKKAELKRGLIREGTLSKEAKRTLTRGHAMNEDKFQGLLRSGTEHLKATAQAIRAGQFAPTPEPNICLFCDHAPLCRRGVDHA